MKFKKEQYKLCYIDGNCAYFTTQNLDKQQGDDWDNAPYQRNAGPPYTSDNNEWDIFKIYFESELQRPHEYFNNSSFSVEDINKGYISWLLGVERINIIAGCSIDEFIGKIKESEGEIYTKVEYES